MDGLNPAKQNGGQAPSDLTRMLVFLIAHFIFALIFTGMQLSRKKNIILGFCGCKK